MYERVALQAIAEQERHHAAAMRLEAMQAKKLQDHREAAKQKASSSTRRFGGDGPKLTVRSVEML